MEGVVSELLRKYWGYPETQQRNTWKAARCHESARNIERETFEVVLEVVSFIMACLDEDERKLAHRKRHTIWQIYNRLVDELGFTRCESSIILA